MSNIIFGPIYSRRFGKSLGIDLSPTKKQCNFDCLYCELAPAPAIGAMEEVVSVEEIVEATEEALERYSDVDFLTVTANGEPTLYPYLLELIQKLNKVKGNAKTLILSNASTIGNEEVQKALSHFDVVKLSLDCATSKCFKKIDRPHKELSIEQIKEGMLTFRALYPGTTVVIEILLVKGLNDSSEEFEALNRFLTQLKPHRIDISTIDRPPAYAVQPLDKEELFAAAKQLDPALKVLVAHRSNAGNCTLSFDKDGLLSTLAKRPLSELEVAQSFDEKSKALLDALIKEKKVGVTDAAGVRFYVASTRA